MFRLDPNSPIDDPPMRGFCEKCGGQFNDQMLCPNCGAQLQTRFVPTKPVLLPSEDALDSLDRVPFFSRFLVGCLLVAGCFIAGGHLLAAVHGPQEAGSPAKADQLVGLLSLSVFFGALVSGTANHRAEITGFLLGLGSAATLLTANFLQDLVSPKEWLIGMPMMQGLVGALAGFSGRMLYLPAPRFRSTNKGNNSLTTKKTKKAVPIGWASIIVAVVAANVTLVYAEPIRQRLVSMLSASGNSYGASQFVVWEITMLGTFLAGIVAGLNRRAGFRQGLLAGTFTTFGVCVAMAQQGTRTIPAAEFWMEQFSFSSDSAGLMSALAGSVFLTVTLGGWLGSHLFPPRKRRVKLR